MCSTSISERFPASCSIPPGESRALRAEANSAPQDRAPLGGGVSPVLVSGVDHAVSAAGLATSSSWDRGPRMSFMLASDR